MAVPAVTFEARPRKREKKAGVGPAYIVEVEKLDPMRVTLIRKYDEAHTLYRIPFGPARGQLIIRETGRMNWKKQKGKDFYVVALKHGNLAYGNCWGIAISKYYARTKGVVEVTLPDGRKTFYPKKALEQKNWYEHKEEIKKIYEEVLKEKLTEEVLRAKK